MPAVYRRRFCDILRILELNLSPPADTPLPSDGAPQGSPTGDDERTPEAQTNPAGQDSALSAKRFSSSDNAASTRSNASLAVFGHPKNISADGPPVHALNEI